MIRDTDFKLFAFIVQFTHFYIVIVIINIIIII